MCDNRVKRNKVKFGGSELMLLNWIYGKIRKAVVIILIYFIATVIATVFIIIYFVARNSVSNVVLSCQYVIKRHLDFLKVRKVQIGLFATDFRFSIFLNSRKVHTEL